MKTLPLCSGSPEAKRKVQSLILKPSFTTTNNNPLVRAKGPRLLLVYFLSTHTWIHSYLHRADSDQDSKMSFKEIKSLLRMVNVDMNDMYAYRLFKVTAAPSPSPALLWSYLLQCLKLSSSCIVAIFR